MARQVVDEANGSGLSDEDFCRNRGLQVQRLKRWRGRLVKATGPASTRGPAQAGPFVEVVARDEAGVPNAATQVEVMLANGRRLRAPAAIAPSQLAALAAALDGQC